MILLAEWVLRKRRLSVGRNLVEMIPFVFVNVIVCSSGIDDETVWIEVRSVAVKDLDIDEFIFAYAPLPSLK
jgi:hypothetical protein